MVLFLVRFPQNTVKSDTFLRLLFQKIRVKIQFLACSHFKRLISPINLNNIFFNIFLIQLSWVKAIKEAKKAKLF